jgi:BirA family transcriptional regulator, biotin operon repressor / biotin---[acetyl-CoA-carboxylase] ligase
VAKAPELPPLLQGRRVKLGSDPFRVAARDALKHQAGAGDLYWSEDQARMSITLVLEPDVSDERCNDMLFVAMVAFGDAVGALAPPEIGVFYHWPQSILVNGAQVGAARLKLSLGRTEDGVPDWLVVGIDAVLKPRKGLPEPGYYKGKTSLWDEGCGNITRLELLESYARHLKTWIFEWESEGPRPVRERWMARLAHPPGETVRVHYEGAELEGTFLGLDDAGNMLMKHDGDTAVLVLRHALDLGAFELA